MNFLETTIYRIILKTYLFFEGTGRQNSFERFSYLRVLTERLTEECLDAWQRDTGLEASRYNNLLSRICGKDETDSNILCNALDRVVKQFHISLSAHQIRDLNILHHDLIVRILFSCHVDSQPHSEIP